MRMTKKLYKACSDLLKDFECSYTYENDKCKDITDCPKCEFYVSDEDFESSYNVIKEELEKNRERCAGS